MKTKRLFALLLTFVLCFGLFAPAALAEEDSDLPKIGTAEFYSVKLGALCEILVDLGLFYEEGTALLAEAVVTYDEMNSGFASAVGYKKGMSENYLLTALGAYFVKKPAQFEPFANTLYQLHDQYSHYMDAVTYEASYTTSDSYIGIGVELDSANPRGNFILGVFPNSPADEAGVLAGDEILTIDGTDVTKMQYTQLGELIRGEENTFVTIEVRRGNKKLSFWLERLPITISNIEFLDMGNGVAYVRVTRFGDLQTFFDFVDIYSNLPYEGFRSVIIDLRNNPGGSMDVLLSMLGYVVWEKRDEAFSIFSRDEGLVGYTSFSAGWRPNSLTILVNGQSASAAEVFAGSLQENGFATVIGEQSYGKGVGQYHLSFVDDSSAVITNFEIILPGGVQYNEVGIVPDIEVSLAKIPYEMPALSPLDKTRSMRIGSKGANVLALEERLALLGCLGETPDDEFDEATLAAVNTYQRIRSLRVVSSASTSMLDDLVKAMGELKSSYTFFDSQLDAAMKIATESAKKPLDYVLPKRDFD